jgi:hypothetical protein
MAPLGVSRTPGTMPKSLLKISDTAIAPGRLSRCGSNCGGSAGLVVISVPPALA